VTSDDAMWAPPGGGDQPPSGEPSASSPALPDPPSQWAPPTPEPLAASQPAPSPSAPAADTDEPDPAVESVVVGPVGADPSSAPSKIGRVVAAGLAMAMVGGGAFLAFGASNVDGGADSPEAAFSQALEAVEAGDLIALAEVMEPGERDTLFEAGFDFLDELMRLEVLADDVDLAAFDGVGLSLDDPQLRVEFARNDLARIHVDAGRLDTGIEVERLPLGRRVLDRLGEEQRTFADRQVEIIDGFDWPVVAVEREGRWYLSVWYTAAENLRLQADEPLPDLEERPAPIGAATPEDAAARFLEEAARLDLARMVGMLDPVEAAALYDYAPLFLDDASVAANEFLEWTEAEGWSWAFDELSFRSEIDGDVATVFLERLVFSAAGNSGSASLTVGPGELSVEVTLIDDFWDEQTTWTVAVVDGCAEVEIVSASDAESFDSCEEDASVALAVPDELDWQSVGVVARRVDERWYLSPLRTGFDAVIGGLEDLEGDDLDLVLDQVLDVPGIVLGTSDPFAVAPASEDPPVGPSVGLELANADLLVDDLDLLFAYDLDADQAAWELDFFVPGLDAVEVDRGLYATIDVVGGEVALIVVEVSSGEDASVVVERVALDRDGGAIESPSAGMRFEFTDDFGDPVLVEFDGSRITLVGVYGATRDAALEVLDRQTTD